MTERQNGLPNDAHLIFAADDKDEIVRAALPVLCSQANASGGKVAVLFDKSPVSADEARRALVSSLSDKSRISENTVKSIEPFYHKNKEHLLIEVAPALWTARPVFVNSDPAQGVYRGYEGEHFVSGRHFLFLMARDSVDIQRDNERIGAHVAIDGEAVKNYRALLRVRRPFPKWDMLDEGAFLARIGVVADDEMTRAGALMFGSGENRLFDAENIWKLIEKYLPKLKEISTSPESERALREAFFNSIIHADYSTGGVEIFHEGRNVVFKNSGVPRVGSPNAGLPAAICRNLRIMKMLYLVGLAGYDGRGMGIIKNFYPNAELEINLERWETTMALPVFPPEKKNDAAQPKQARFDFYPVVELIDLPPSPSAPPPSEREAEDEAGRGEPTDAEAHFVVVDVPEEQIEPVLVEPEPEPEIEPEPEPEPEPEIEPEPEPEPEPAPAPAPRFEPLEPKPLHVFMGNIIEEEEDPEEPEVPDEAQFVDPENFPVIVQMVRNNVHTPAVLVREALLDYCRGTFRSLSEISGALLRSEASLKRRYIKPLISQKALEVNERDEYRSVRGENLEGEK